jgi:hypothetical protein
MLKKGYEERRNQITQEAPEGATHFKEECSKWNAHYIKQMYAMFDEPLTPAFVYCDDCWTYEAHQHADLSEMIDLRQ